MPASQGQVLQSSPDLGVLKATVSLCRLCSLGSESSRDASRPFLLLWAEDYKLPSYGINTGFYC